MISPHSLTAETEQGNDAWQLEWRLRTYDWDLIERYCEGDKTSAALTSAHGTDGSATAWQPWDTK